MAAPVPSAAPPTAIGGQQQQVANVNAFMSIYGRMKDSGAAILQQQKPWTEVLDRSALSKPANVGEALSRLRKNAAYFKVNYLVVILSTCALSFVANPGALLYLLILAAAWMYTLFIQTSPLVISGRQISEREKIAGMAAISFIVIFFLTDVGTTFFTAVMLGSAMVCTHGAFREPDNLFLDEQEAQPLFGIPVTSAVATGLAAV